MYHSFLIHPSADGHLGCFHVLAIINSAAMNTGVHVSLSDLVSSVCMPRTGIAGSYGSSISWCSLFKSLYWIGYNITSVLWFSFLVAKQSMWDFSSLTRDHTCTPSVEGVCVCVCVCVWKSLSHFRLFAIPSTVAHQPPLSMEFSRQEY